MRPVRFQTDALVMLLRKEQITTMDEMKAALGTTVDMTVFRKLREISYHSSYSHRGRYYALDEVAHFDRQGLWRWRGVGFSRFGSLVDTVEELVHRAAPGLFAYELADMLGVQVDEPLLQLVRSNRLTRQKTSGAYLYFSADATRRRQQLMARGTVEEPLASRSGRALEESKAAIVLFLSLLDERQRRLFAGLESMLLGWGGDRHIADLTGLDVHTIAKGRRELFEGDLHAERIRRPGGGRKAMEKKRPK